ncbi:MAG: ABC transporter substrate-binding protein [Clostridiaceae bacterium]|nr:ABC transporter substrate-binding protein [Clostridiaceae bacterium]
MRSMKRFLCLALVLVFAFTLALSGCGEKATPAADPTTKKTDAPAPKAEDKPAESAVPAETVELTMTLVGNKQETDTDLVMEKINEYLADKINIKLNLQVFGWGDPYEQKVNTMLSSGEPFDVCFTANWAANYYKNAAAGYFTELNDLLAKYPAIYEIAGKDFVDGSALDGINYAVPTHKETVHNWGYLLQKAVVDQYGIDISTLKKMEDLEPWFDKIKADGKITPLLVVGGDSPFQFLDWDRVSDDNVPGALYSDNRDNTIVNHFLAPESVDMYKKLRDYYQKGYIASDAATMENTAEQMKTAKYFAVESSLKPGKDAEMTGSTGVEWVQIDITQPVMSNRETTGAMLAIPAASKNAERAFQFIEILYTDDVVRNLLNFGIEGTHYNVNADGRITQTQEGLDRYNMGPGWRYGDQFKDLLLDNEDPNKWADFGKYNDAGLVLNSLGFVYNDSDVSTESSACKTVTGTYNRQLQCGAVDVDPILKKYEDELKASGVDTLIADMQTQYDAWRAKVGK